MIALFVLKLSAGITLMWWLMPRKDVTDGFFRIQMRLLLGLAVLAALLLSSAGTWDDLPDAPSAAALSVATAGQQRLVEIGVAVAAYAGSVFWALGRRLPGNICIHMLTLASIVALGLHSCRVPNQASLPLQLLSDFSSAAVLGSVMTGMLLGHWYLTTPTMSIRPLWWFIKAISAAGGVRLVASAWSAAQFGFPSEDLTRTIWLATRWIGGIVVPLAVAVIVWRILKYRNTQSATGVLFAGLILVFMAEMAASLLERDMKIPF
ncbi:MAG: hypothetical protein R3C19_22155 [Planctomycetaceae bacterium]